MSLTFDQLPTVLRAEILDLAGLTEYWKRRFGNDVLPMLEKGIKLVSTFNGEPCNDCYLNGMKYNSSVHVCSGCETLNHPDDTFADKAPMELMSWEDFVNHPCTQSDVVLKAHAPNGYQHIFGMIYGRDWCTMFNRGGINYEINRHRLGGKYKPVFKFLPK